jgi:hypothetical protein
MDDNSSDEVEENNANENIQAVSNDNEDLDSIIRRHWSSIITKHRPGKVVETLNVKIWDPEVEPESIQYGANVWSELISVWKSLKFRAKMNCSVGCILKHKKTEEYRYYHASSNNATVFPSTKLISTEEDLREFYNNFTKTDLREQAALRRPSTVWRLYAVTNVSFYFFKLLGMGRIGDASVKLPKHILNHRHIITVLKSRNGKPYDDNLCFFRCLTKLVLTPTLLQFC